jgi:PPE-repeat protein
LTPFSSPPQTTNPAGTGTQAAAVTQAAASPAGATPNTLSQVANMLQSPASTALADAVLGPIVSLVASPGSQAVNKLTATLGEFGSVGYQSSFLAAGLTNPLTALMMPMPSAAPAIAAPEAALGSLASSHGPGGGGVSAGLGRAATVGGLSVPQSWSTESPAIRLAATALPAAGLDGLPQAGPAGLGGMPMMGGMVNASRNGAAGPRPESRLKVIPQMPGESGGNERTPDRGMTPTGRAADAVDALSERERYELHTLREEIAELAIERDAVDRLIREAMRR